MTRLKRIHILYMDVEFQELYLVTGSSYIELTDWIRNKKQS